MEKSAHACIMMTRTRSAGSLTCVCGVPVKLQRLCLYGMYLLSILSAVFMFALLCGNVKNDPPAHLRVVFQRK